MFRGKIKRENRGEKQRGREEYLDDSQESDKDRNVKGMRR
jgi:hypothetical protein